MCCLLASMVACSLVPCTSQEFRPVTWSTTTAWISLTAGPKHAATFCMISQLYYELHPGIWSCSGALPRSLSWLAGVLSTLPIPRGLTLVPVTGRSTSPYRRPLHAKRKSGRSTFCWSGTGKGRISCICCRMHCTSLCKPVISTATLSSSNSAVLPPIEHANVF
jgi:hypothetical protein